MSLFFRWDPVALGTGVGEMDEQHQVLIAMMNDLARASERGVASGDLSRRIEALLVCTRKHFADEERYMDAIGYPGASRHRQFHKELLEKLDEHVAAFDVATADRLPPAFLQFLRFWLGAHIRGIDKKYGDFARAGAAAPEPVSGL